MIGIRVSGNCQPVLHTQTNSVVRRPSQRKINDEALYQLFLKNCITGQIINRHHRTDERYGNIVGKRRQRKTQETTVMVFRPYLHAVVVEMMAMLRILMIGKQVHELLGSSTKKQQHRQQRSQETVCNPLYQPGKGKIV